MPFSIVNFLRFAKVVLQEIFHAVTNPKLKILALKFPDGFVERLTLYVKINENENVISARYGYAPLDRLDAEFTVYDNQTQIYELLKQHG